MEYPLDRLRGFFEPIDWHFARFTADLDGSDNSGLFLAALLTSHRTGLGDICLDLATAGGRNIEELVEMEGPGLTLPETAEWIKVLHASPVVCGEDGKAPLVMDRRGRVYLYRYYQYERQLAEDIAARYERLNDHVDRRLLEDGIKRLFGLTADTMDRQVLAAANAVMRPFSIIAGGPGTGKTSTVVKVMALVAEQYDARGERPLIAMTAPTGKASMRLQQAVARVLDDLPVTESVKENLPSTASTIHRLLGGRYGSHTFYHGRDNPLPHDLLLVDETSMADLPLLAKFFQAVRPRAAVILLGDRDQLASVEAGAAFGDICAGADVPSEHSPTVPERGKAAGSGSIVILKDSYRFGAESGIGRLADALREGNYDMAKEVLDSGRFSDVRWRKLPQSGGLIRAIEESVLDGYGDYLSAAGPADALDAMEKFMILSPLRRGPWGVQYLNGLVETILKKNYLIENIGKWYHRRPVMINVNDYGTGLYNGDTGVVFGRDDPVSSHVYFRGTGGDLRMLIPSRLPSHETSFVLTVHKSQGSEYDRVLIILPERYSPVLTRELLYTAVTRARKSVHIWADEGVLKKTVENMISRTSGLREQLWGSARGDV